MKLTAHDREVLDEALSRHGLRSTRQREHVFGVLLKKRDHPTADEVYSRAKTGMPGISLATVYNCLETLVQCGLVKQVNHERESSRYCPNPAPHAHFHDRTTGRVVDIDLPVGLIDKLRDLLPAGYAVEDIKIDFHGVADKASRKPAAA